MPLRTPSSGPRWATVRFLEISAREAHIPWPVLAELWRRDQRQAPGREPRRRDLAGPATGLLGQLLATYGGERHLVAAGSREITRVRLRPAGDPAELRWRAHADGPGPRCLLCQGTHPAGEDHHTSEHYVTAGPAAGPVPFRDVLALAVAGLQPEDLDGLVHDVASRRASDINNAGLAAQVRYLVAELGEQGARAELADLTQAGTGGDSR